MEYKKFGRNVELYIAKLLYDRKSHLMARSTNHCGKNYSWMFFVGETSFTETRAIIDYCNYSPATLLKRKALLE